MSVFGFDAPIHAVVLGARGGLGNALVERVVADSPHHRVTATSRSQQWATEATEPRVRRAVVDLTDEDSVAALGRSLEDNVPDVILNCTGLLHDDDIQPERTWRRIEPEAMMRVLAVNTVGVALAVKHLLPTLPRDRRGVFASVSARVGSIGDNRLGGWYSYRASKAAQNMVVRCAAIEAARRWPHAVVVAVHPGTVTTALSEPFTRRRSPDSLFSPATSAAHLDAVLQGLGPQDTGQHYAWDGQVIEW